MSDLFFEKPVLNSPYDCPKRHWERTRGPADPADHRLASPRRVHHAHPQAEEAESGAGTAGEGAAVRRRTGPAQRAAALRPHRHHQRRAGGGRRLAPASPPTDWRVTPETARLLQHWRHHHFSGIRPFFCQVEAVETAIWLTEVAPKIGKAGQHFSITWSTPTRRPTPS